MDSTDESARLAAALGSQYEVVRLIGRGGMGRVYLAREPFLDRQVAVKVLPAEIADTGDATTARARKANSCFGSEIPFTQTPSLNHIQHRPDLRLERGAR